MSTTPPLLGDRYEIGRLLGAGGMAEVYEGRDRLLARRVAIKVLLAEFAQDPAFLVRFKREAQAAASLSHPNIVAVYDTGVQGSTHFIVMEYVEGRTLRDLLRIGGPPPPERAAGIAADVCVALGAAHARGLIHRDVKPANLMLTPDGTVKVMDFGIARATSSETITQAHAVIGTAQYISPEQVQGREADARSDLYSLGCLLYEMLSGRVPFSGEGPVAIAYRHVREDPTPPRQLNPRIPPALEAVTLRAMAKHPSQRYQTAAELRADLERALTGRPLAAPMAPAGGFDEPAPVTQAMPPPYAYRPAGHLDGPRSAGHAGRSKRRRRVAAVVFSLVTVALAAAAFAVVARNARPDAAEPSALSTLSTTLAPPTTQQTTTTTPPTTAQQTTTTPPTTAQQTTTTAQQTTTTQSGQVVVPNVLRQREDNARNELEDLGFEVDSQDVPISNQNLDGRVIAQSPRADNSVPEGSTVQIFIGRVQ